MVDALQCPPSKATDSTFSLLSIYSLKNYRVKYSSHLWKPTVWQSLVQRLFPKVCRNSCISSSKLPIGTINPGQRQETVNKALMPKRHLSHFLSSLFPISLRNPPW